MSRTRGISADRLLLRPAVLAPAVVLFAIMVAHALLETARDALFLTKLGAHHLASAYLVMAAAALAAVGAVRRWGALREPRRMLIAFLVFALAGTCVLAATITLLPSLVFVLYVWTGFVATLVVPSFWTVLDRSLRIAEAKRVFGAIGAGGVLGAMCGSALASGLGRVMDAHYLVTAGAVAFALALVAATLLAPRAAVDELPAKSRRLEALSRSSQRYVRLLVVVGVVSTIGITLGDLTFKRVLGERIAGSDLATAFGAIYTGLNLIGLVIQVVVTPRLLVRSGVGTTLMVLPLIVLATALGFALTGALIAVIALELGNGGLRHSLHRVGSEILYLPVPAAVRDGWKLVADAISLRGGQAAAAFIVFGLMSLHASAREVGAVTTAVGLIWLIAIAIVRRAYIAQFRDTLQAGEIQRDVALPELDADSIQLLVESLSSPDEVEALAALDLLARRGNVPALVLYHPRGEVVRHALALLEGKLRPDVARVLDHLRAHSDPQIRAAALATSGRIGYHRDALVEALADPDTRVRAAAYVALAKDPEHAATISRGLAQLLDGTTEDRVALASAIAFVPDLSFRPLLYELLAHGEPEVMRVVLHVLQRVPALAELDRLVPLLANAQVRGEVRPVLLAVGSRALEQLIATLDDPETPLAVRRHLPRTIMRFRSRAAAAALVARLPHEPDHRTTYKLLRALGRMCNEDATLVIEPAPVHEYVHRVLRDAARYAMFVARFRNEPSTGPTSALILELLVEKRRIAIEHLFRALGVLYPRAGLRSVHDALTGDDEARRSAAREILEATVPADIRQPLLDIVDNRITPATQLSYEAVIAALLADPSESLRCVVAHHVAERHLVALRDDLTRLRPVEGPLLVRNAFDQAIESLHA